MSNYDTDEVVFRRDPQNQETYDEIWDDTALIEAYDRAVGLIKEEIANRNNSRKTTKVSENNHAGKKPKKCKKKSKQKSKKWKVGDLCEAIYSEDGLSYTARIKSINASTGSCIIEYVGYGNQEEVNFDNIRPSSPKTKYSDNAAQNAVNSETENVDADSEYCSDHQCSQSGSHHAESETGSCCHLMPHWLPFMNGTWPFLNHPHVPPVWSMSNFPSPCQHSQTCNPRVSKPMGIPPLPQMTFDNADDALASTFMAWYMSGYHTGYYHVINYLKIIIIVLSLSSVLKCFVSTSVMLTTLIGNSIRVLYNIK